MYLSKQSPTMRLSLPLLIGLLKKFLFTIQVGLFMFVHNLTGPLLFSESKTSMTKSPVKKAGPKGPASQRKPKTSPGSSESGGGREMVEEERRCPLDQCDSLGHLSGKLARHFTLEACPLYHNKTSQQCKVIMESFTEVDFPSL